MTGGEPSLLRLVAGRVLAFGFAAMLIQLCLVVGTYWRQDEGMARRLIEMQTAALGEGLKIDGGRLGFRPTPALEKRYRASDEASGPGTDGLASGYHARIRTYDGAVLFSTCGQQCSQLFLPLAVNPPSFWLRTLHPGKPLSVVGGRTVTAGPERVHVEIAVIRDPDFLLGTVLAGEVFDHMLMPMTLMLTLVIGATIWSLRTMLVPVGRAAAEADAIDPRRGATRLTTSGMPREVARLARAVNRALDRINELIRSQKVFASAISHEIRTPVSVVRMELERIDDARARKAIEDLDGLTHTLEQLTALARLEAVDPGAFEDIDLTALAEDTVAGLAPYVFGTRRSISLCAEGSARIRAVPALVENLVRNLVENAVRHTPVGTAITVAVGPGPVLDVADDGPGIAASGVRVEAGTVKAAGGLGLGLEIVRRIAALHGAACEVRSAPGKGTSVRIRFPAAGEGTARP